MQKHEIKPQLRIHPMLYHGLDFFRADSEHPELLKALRRYDKAAVVYYNKSINRWSLARATPRGIFHVLTWHWGLEARAESGPYRDLSWDLLKYIRSIDLWRGFRHADEMSDQLEDEQEAHEQKEDATFAGDIAHLSRSNRPQQQKIKDLASSF